MNSRPTGHALVLVADDEAHIRMVVSERLRAAGYEVVEARDGEEAWELAQKDPPDAVVTDLQMPFMTGLELCTRLRGNPATASIPALLLTARGHILNVPQLETTNIRAVMSKPFSVREVTAKVQELISGREAEERAETRSVTAGRVDGRAIREAA